MSTWDHYDVGLTSVHERVRKEGTRDSFMLKYSWGNEELSLVYALRAKGTR